MLVCIKRNSHLWSQRFRGVCHHLFVDFPRHAINERFHWGQRDFGKNSKSREWPIDLKLHTRRQGRINTKFGLMLLPRQGPISSRHSRQTKTLASQPPFTECGYIEHHRIVQFEINIKLSTIKGKGLYRLIARKETRNSAIAERPRCRVGP